MAPFYLMPEKSDEITKQFLIACDRLEYATELIKMYVGYADGHLSKTEKMLLKLYKEFLGNKHES